MYTLFLLLFYCIPSLYLLNYSQMGVGSYFTMTLRIIGSKHFLFFLLFSRKCQSALAYSFIEYYTCPWLLPHQPSLPVHPATPFKEGYHNDYEKWLLKKPDVTHYLNIKGVWANNKFGLLIKVWKGKELPSEVKCHCQSCHESLLTSKDISPELCHSIYGNTSVPKGLISLMWDRQRFSSEKWKWKMEVHGKCMETSKPVEHNGQINSGWTSFYVWVWCSLVYSITVV